MKHPIDKEYIYDQTLEQAEKLHAQLDIMDTFGPSEAQFEEAHETVEELVSIVKDLLSVDIVYCKDCKKHNIGIGDFLGDADGNRHWYWKDEACPLVEYRGKAKGHEFDYQYCCCGKEKDE